jgi:pyrimidine-nucleoside phosphorylase
MKIQDIIEKKQNKQRLTENEIAFVVSGFSSDEISKQEMTLFLRAVVKNDLDEKETFFLTKAMLASGEKYDLSTYKNTIDKHSTGGVSDNTTFIVVPLFALFGFTCIKMSGGALGHTGGTADKIKVFKGINNQLTKEEIDKVVSKTGACFITSSQHIAPADKKIYALRDEIGAMSNSLIASSIMSKKLATGNKNLILDVKYGNGALVESKKQAKKLALLMKKIGEFYGVETSFVLGDMNQPLGQAIGNTAEVFEVLANLQTAQKTRLLKHSLRIVAHALAKPLKKNKSKIYKAAYEMVKNGKVLAKLKEIIIAQNGKFFGNFILKPVSFIEAEENKKIKKIDTKKLGLIDKELRQTHENYQGFQILVSKGQKVVKGQGLFQLYFKPKNEKNLTKELISTLQ